MSTRPDHVDVGVLFAHARGALAPEARAPVDAHLAACARCASRRAGLVEVGAALAADTPTALDTARAKRRLKDAILDDRRVAARAWRPVSVFATAVLALFGGATLAAISSTLLAPPAPSSAERVGSAVAVPVPVDEVDADVADARRAPDGATDVERDAPTLARDETEPKRALEVRRDARPPRETSAPRVRVASGTLAPREAFERAAAELATADPGDARFVDVGDLAALAGDARAALVAYARALPGPRGAMADQRLDQLVTSGTIAEADVLAAIAADSAVAESAEGMKRRCAMELRHRGDREAVALCQRFAEVHPDHPAVRRLALAAGRTAEFRLGDPTLAVLEYSRALLLSEVAGVAGTEALFARARAQAKLGALSAARADLGLYLHQAPEARFRDDVAALARLLDLEDAPAAP